MSGESELCSFLRSWSETMGFEGFSRAADALEQAEKTLRRHLDYHASEMAQVDVGECVCQTCREAREALAVLRGES